MATFTLTTGVDTFIGTDGNDTVIGTAATLNMWDSLTGGAGTDTLMLYGQGYFQIDLLTTGFESIRLSGGTISTYLYLGSQSLAVIGSGQEKVFLGSGAVTCGGINVVASPSAANWNAGNSIDGGSIVLNSNLSDNAAFYDLTTNRLSNILSLSGASYHDYSGDYGSNLTVQINSAVAGGVANFNTGGVNAKLVTSDAVLDLSHSTVSGFTVESSNATGTNFTVHDLGTAYRVVGGSGTDTLTASGFAFSEVQRDVIFGTSSIEKIVDSSGTYTVGPPYSDMTYQEAVYYLAGHGILRSSMADEWLSQYSEYYGQPGQYGTTVIETNGSTRLTEVGIHFFLSDSGGLYDSGGSRPSLKYAGADFADGQFGTWAPIGAEKTATGYQVAWKNASSGLYTAWNTDSNGNYVSGVSGLTGHVSGTNYALKLLETSLHQDLNGDGQIGLVTTAVETQGSTDLTHAADHYFLYDGGGSGPSLKYAGADFADGQFGTWAPIGAEKTATGYQVAWKNASSGLYTAWNTDSNGNYVSGVSGLTGHVSGTNYALKLLETSLHQDLNGDGQIGLVTTAVETQGSTDLTHAGDHYFLYDGGGSGPSLKFGGADFVDGQFGAAWAPIGAEKTATGYQVAWKDASTGLYTAWNTDNNGNYVSGVSGLTGHVSGTNYALELLETSFHQDLNGDGQIGLATTAAETQGATDLTHAGDHYFLYDSVGSGPSLKYGGADFVDGQFGTWAPIGAEKTATGFQVAWKDASTGLYTAWNTDNNGNYVSGVSGLTGHVSGTDSNLQTLEPSFHQDLNGDGVVGHFASVLDGHLGGQTLTSSGVGPTALIGGPNDILNAGAGADTFVFRPGFGSNTINGFAGGTDAIQFDHTIFADVADVQGHMQQIGSDVVIAHDLQNVVTLHDILLTNLHLSDFHIV